MDEIPVGTSERAPEQPHIPAPNTTVRASSVQARGPRKGGSRGRWQPQLGAVELTQQAGNFWRTAGFSVNARCFLFPEEALFLVEERKLSVTDAQDAPLSLRQLYALVLGAIPLQCYLAYVKLRSLDYIVQRRNKQVALFAGDADLRAHVSRRPPQQALPLLDEAVSFVVFANKKGWTKALAHSIRPAAHVVVTHGSATLSAQLTMELLRLAAPVPLVVAVVSRSGFVFLEEFTDSLLSLEWDLDSLARSSAAPPALASEEGALADVDVEAMETLLFALDDDGEQGVGDEAMGTSPSSGNA